MTPVVELLQRAEADAALELRQEAPHPLGLALGLAAFGFGVWASGHGHATWGWLALAGVVASMALARWWIERGPGWRVEFASRRVEPVAQRAEAVMVEGRGWSVRTGPGDKFASMAIDLLHDDRGRVARLFERPALRRAHRRQICALADRLAQRLRAERIGVRY